MTPYARRHGASNRYEPTQIEPRWQSAGLRSGLYKTDLDDTASPSTTC
jgi:hypothetical protein